MATPYAGDVRLLMEHMAKALVDAPDEVIVDAEPDERGGEVLYLEVAENDYGKVIGRSGRTARCLRNIISVAGMKAGKRMQLEIVE